MNKRSQKNSYTPKFQWSFLYPKYWGTWLLIPLFFLLAFIPFRVRDKIAEIIAKQLIKINSKAKKRALINLKECFPDKSEQERNEILKFSYINAGCIILGSATFMIRSKSYLEQHTIFYNEQMIADLITNKEKIILLMPHSCALEYPGMLLSSRGYSLATMVRKHSNPVINWLINIQRLKYSRNRGKIHERGDGIKPFIKSIREGYMGYYLPDQDHGPKHSIFAPFFATQKATLSGLGRLAKLTQAKIIPLMSIYNRETGNIEMLTQKPLKLSPSGNEEQNARMQNECIEKFLKNDPSQYIWTMNILRSHPNGSKRY